jgi:hypothetical protein
MIFPKTGSHPGSSLGQAFRESCSSTNPKTLTANPRNAQEFINDTTGLEPARPRISMCLLYLTNSLPFY